MDRFWVLERSADVEGADHIIQQRLAFTIAWAMSDADFLG
jgi:hypothetical protein